MTADVGRRYECGSVTDAAMRVVLDPDVALLASPEDSAPVTEATSLRPARVVAVVAMRMGGASAQTTRADSLLEHGALSRAESLYFAAVRRRSARSDGANGRSGKYLVLRGAPRVGMTLFEEALQFGADPAVSQDADCADVPGARRISQVAAR